MKHSIGILPLLLSLALMVGCAGDYSVTTNDSPASVSSPDTNVQDAIDRMNQQMALDAATAVAQQQFLAGMAAAQETMNNANNNQAISNWLRSISFQSPARVDADLMSTTGVPSNASIGPIFIRVPSISRTVTGCSPSGFGRAGERV
jgi:hypothetical protein